MASSTLSEAAEILAEILPGSAGFLPDQIVGLSPGAWLSLDIEDPDVAVGTRLLTVCQAELAEDLIVVTDASWREDVGPLVVTRDELPGVIASHLERYGDVFFSSDVVLVSPANGIVVVVHHNGLVALLHGRPNG